MRDMLKDSGGSLVLSVLVHIILLGFFVVRLFAPEAIPAVKGGPAPIKAVVMNKLQVKQYEKMIRDDALVKEQQRKRDLKKLLEKQAREQEKIRKTKKLKELAKNKRIKELKRKKRLRREKIKLEKKRLEKEKAIARIKQKKERARKERLRKIKETKRRKQAEIRRKRLAKKRKEIKRKLREKKRRQARERKLREAEKRERELAMRQEQMGIESAKHSSMSSDRQRWMSAIKAHLDKYWRRPPNLSDTDKCVAVIRQTKSGTVIDRNVVGCDGHVKLSVEQAIDAAGQLPKAPTPEVFDAKIEMTFVKPRR